LRLPQHTSPRSPDHANLPQIVGDVTRPTGRTDLSQIVAWDGTAPEPGRERRTVSGVLETRDMVAIVATFVVVAIVVVLIGAAADASLTTLGMMAGAGAAFVQYRRRTQRRSGSR